MALVVSSGVLLVSLGVAAAGPGPRSVLWAPRTGDRTVVVMHAHGSRPVSADVSAGAELPVLKAAARVMLVLAVPGLLAAGLRPPRGGARVPRRPRPCGVGRRSGDRLAGIPTPWDRPRRSHACRGALL